MLPSAKKSFGVSRHQHLLQHLLQQEMSKKKQPSTGPKGFFLDMLKSMDPLVMVTYVVPHLLACPEILNLLVVTSIIETPINSAGQRSSSCSFASDDDAAAAKKKRDPLLECFAPWFHEYNTQKRRQGMQSSCAAFDLLDVVRGIHCAAPEINHARLMNTANLSELLVNTYKVGCRVTFSQCSQCMYPGSMRGGHTSAHSACTSNRKHGVGCATAAEWMRTVLLVYAIPIHELCLDSIDYATGHGQTISDSLEATLGHTIKVTGRGANAIRLTNLSLRSSDVHQLCGILMLAARGAESIDFGSINLISTGFDLYIPRQEVMQQPAAAAAAAALPLPDEPYHTLEELQQTAAAVMQAVNLNMDGMMMAAATHTGGDDTGVGDVGEWPAEPAAPPQVVVDHGIGNQLQFANLVMLREGRNYTSSEMLRAVSYATKISTMKHLRLSNTAFAPSRLHMKVVVDSIYNMMFLETLYIDSPDAIYDFAGRFLLHVEEEMKTDTAGRLKLRNLKHVTLVFGPGDIMGGGFGGNAAAVAGFESIMLYTGPATRSEIGRRQATMFSHQRCPSLETITLVCKNNPEASIQAMGLLEGLVVLRGAGVSSPISTGSSMMMSSSSDAAAAAASGGGAPPGSKLKTIRVCARYAGTALVDEDSKLRTGLGSIAENVEVIMGMRRVGGREYVPGSWTTEHLS